MKKLCLCLIVLWCSASAAYAQTCPGPTYAGTTRNYKFTTRQFSDAVPTTASGLVVKAYKAASTTEATTGITLTFTSGFDGLAGLVDMEVNYGSDGTFYASASDISFVATTGTVGGTSVVGEVICNVHISPAPAVAEIPSVNTTYVAGTAQTALNILTALAALARTDGTSPFGGTYDPATDSLQAQLDSAVPMTASAATNINGFFDNASTTATATVGNVSTTLLASVIRTATAAGGAARTITLDSGASATDNVYTGNFVIIVSSTGISQKRQIVSYVGSTKIATVDRNWITNPTSSSVYSIVP